jgi:hypothetical protein
MQKDEKPLVTDLHRNIPMTKQKMGSTPSIIAFNDPDRYGTGKQKEKLRQISSNVYVSYLS